MNKLSKLFIIASIAGFILAAFLKVVQLLTGNQAYVLLFETDYIVVIQDLQPQFLIGFIFHFVICYISVVILYYLLTVIHLEKSILMYVIFFTTGSGLLFPLTMFSESTPEITDLVAWFYWLIGHILFSLVVGVLIRKWV